MGNLWGKIRSLKDRAWLALFGGDEAVCEYFRRQGARIGSGTRILVNNLGSEPYLVTIGSHCLISFEVAFITHDGSTWVFREQYPEVNRYGTITVHDNCFVGGRSILLPGVEVGPNSIVGAGAVVTKNVPPGTIAVGCPARVVTTVDEYAQKCIEESLPLGSISSQSEKRAALTKYLLNQDNE